MAERRTSFEQINGAAMFSEHGAATIGKIVNIIVKSR